MPQKVFLYEFEHPFTCSNKKKWKNWKQIFFHFLGLWGCRPEPVGGPFFGVRDRNSKIATVTPILCLWCTPSQKISPIGPVVWAVRGGAGDLGCSSSCIYASSVLNFMHHENSDNYRCAQNRRCAGTKTCGTPLYTPNPWAKMVHILAGDHLWDSIKGHRGDFWISTYERRYRGLKPEFWTIFWPPSRAKFTTLIHCISAHG